MPQTGLCTDITCAQELTELYECHCCNWLVCLTHLLQHVEVAQQGKKKQLDNLRNDLTSVTYTLELLVERKTHEITQGKELITRAKAKLDTPNCSIEEIQQIFEEINQAIASGEGEHTIVKVESSLSEMKPSVCINDVSEAAEVVQDVHSSAQCVLQDISSPVYNARTLRSNQSASSTMSKSIDHSTAMDTDCDSFSTNEAINGSVKDEAGEEEKADKQEKNGTNRRLRSIIASCPLKFEGAFGLTKAKHGITMCPTHNRKRDVFNHLVRIHNLTTLHALRMCQAIINKLDPATTHLFGVNEVIIDHDRLITCPFSNSMISWIRCCPTGSRCIPCDVESIRDVRLKEHLVHYHRISTRETEKIVQSYKIKLSKIRVSKENHPTSN